MTNKVKLDKKELNAVWKRYLLSAEMTFNYENYQGLNYAYSMYPALKKIYSDDSDKLKEAMESHLSFFNTNVVLGGNLTLGVDCAMEENGASLQDVANLKTSLMGPLAGVGDTLFFVIPKVIFGGIAGYMALEGNPVGLILYVGVFAILRLILGRLIFFKAYEKGSGLITSMGGTMDSILNALSILGMTVVGALIPWSVSASCPLVIKTGELAIEIQPYLDEIMPNLLPAAVVAFAYFMLGKKNMSSTKLIYLIFAIGIIGSLIGIL